jgi:hypothetical protein
MEDHIFLSFMLSQLWNIRGFEIVVFISPMQVFCLACLFFMLLIIGKKELFFFVKLLGEAPMFPNFINVAYYLFIFARGELWSCFS